MKLAEIDLSPESGRPFATNARFCFASKASKTKPAWLRVFDRTKKSLLGGGPSGIGPQKTTSYSYDLADQLVKLDNSIPTTSTVPDAGIISQLSYGYDLAGNRVVKKTLSVRTDPNGTGNTPHFTSTTLKEIYSYDPTYQITDFDISTETSVTHHSFAYDLLGNRTQAS
ncbi:MAG: hypothetical protein WC676_06605 [Candidatus Omnitrophota bacterium]